MGCENEIFRKRKKKNVQKWENDPEEVYKDQPQPYKNLKIDDNIYNAWKIIMV